MTILNQACSRILGAIFGAVAVIALLAAGTILPAAAQTQNMQKYGDPDKEKTPSQIAAEKEAEKAYQRSLGNIPAQKTTDPWGTVRSDDAPPKAAKAAAKAPPAKLKAKTDAKSADSKSGGTAKQ
jgi:hypothetical protein